VPRLRVAIARADDGDVRTFAIACVTAAFLALAPAAFADNVSISVSTVSPEQGIPVTITFSGSGAAIDPDNDGPFLYAVARPAGGTGCQSSFGADQAAAGDASTVLIDGDEQAPGQPFSEQASFDPDQGGSIVCAWLETDADDGDEIATPDEVTAGPVSTSFTAANPQVGPLRVSVPASIRVNEAYNITYGTQTDQDLSLDSIVIPADANGCADSYELELDDLSSPDDIFNGNQDVYGTATTEGIDTESTAGTYTICSWIEGPDNEQIDATNTTTIKVLAASAGASSPGGSAPGVSTSSASGPVASTPGGSEAGADCVVPKYTGTTLATIRKRLRAHGCTVGAVRYVRTHRVASGRVVKLADPPGKKLRHDAVVAITVAKR
jgi:hypothetical protein